jgi:hypothetical protein
MSELEELDKICPSCGSYQYHVRERVQRIVQQMFGKGGDNRQRIQMWPCFDEWHSEGMRREFEALPEEEKKRREAKCDQLLKSFGLGPLFRSSDKMGDVMGRSCGHTCNMKRERGLVWCPDCKDCGGKGEETCNCKSHAKNRPDQGAW